MYLSSDLSLLQFDFVPKSIPLGGRLFSCIGQCPFTQFVIDGGLLVNVCMRTQTVVPTNASSIHLNQLLSYVHISLTHINCISSHHSWLPQGNGRHGEAIEQAWRELVWEVLEKRMYYNRKGDGHRVRWLGGRGLKEWHRLCIARYHLWMSIKVNWVNLSR